MIIFVMLLVVSVGAAVMCSDEYKLQVRIWGGLISAAVILGWFGLCVKYGLEAKRLAKMDTSHEVRTDYQAIGYDVEERLVGKVRTYTTKCTLVDVSGNRRVVDNQFSEDGCAPGARITLVDMIEDNPDASLQYRGALFMAILCGALGMLFGIIRMSSLDNDDPKQISNGMMME